jgi:hypothetical protein
LLGCVAPPPESPPDAGPLPDLSDAGCEDLSASRASLQDEYNEELAAERYDDVARTGAEMRNIVQAQFFNAARTPELCTYDVCPQSAFQFCVDLWQCMSG